MSASRRHPATPRQAEDLFFENLRGLHPDAKLSAAIDRYLRDRPGTPDDEPRGQAVDRPDGAARLAHRRALIADRTRARETRRAEKS